MGIHSVTFLLNLISTPFIFLKTAKESRSTILLMTRRHFSSRFTGTLGGGIWEIIQPMVLISIYWFVFTFGFKVQVAEDIPFTLYFLAGMLPWITFADILSGSSNSVSENAHLLKNTTFPSEVLPIIYIISGFLSHLIFLGIVLFVFLISGEHIWFNILLLLYYFILMSVLLIGFSWITSSFNVYVKDVGQAVTVLLNVWFWATPIVWNKSMIPDTYQWILFLNPMYYIVEGYRSALIEYKGPDAFGIEVLSMWVIAILMLIIGANIFKRLKVTFADTL